MCIRDSLCRAVPRLRAPRRHEGRLPLADALLGALCGMGRLGLYLVYVVHIAPRQEQLLCNNTRTRQGPALRCHGHLLSLLRYCNTVYF